MGAGHCVALELSRSKWLIGSLTPSATRVVTHAVPGVDVTGLLLVLDRVGLQAKRQTGDEVTVEVCYEAGYNGSGWPITCAPRASGRTSSMQPASSCSAGDVGPRQTGSTWRPWHSPCVPS